MSNVTKKFELVMDDTIKLSDGTILYRIRALNAFSDIKPGDLGGYVEKESNLGVYGNAWVYGDAWVYGNAQVSEDACVSGNARVSGDAQVYGNAWVFGNARVSGDAQVYGNARVYGNAHVFGGTWKVSPLQIQGTKWSLNMASKTILRIGCLKHEIPVWLEQYQQIGREYGATEAEVQEYLLYIELAAKLYGERGETQ